MKKERINFDTCEECHPHVQNLSTLIDFLKIALVPGPIGPYYNGPQEMMTEWRGQSAAYERCLTSWYYILISLHLCLTFISVSKSTLVCQEWTANICFGERRCHQPSSYSYQSGITVFIIQIISLYKASFVSLVLVSTMNAWLNMPVILKLNCTYCTAYI